MRAWGGGEGVGGGEGMGRREAQEEELRALVRQWEVRAWGGGEEWEEVREWVW